MKAANKTVQTGHLWSFEGAGRFLGTPDRNTAWKLCPGHLRSNKFAFKHYFSTKEGEDKVSIHDECVRAIPQAFINSGVSSSSWRSASQADILAFVTAMFVTEHQLWLNDKEGSRAHSCMVSLALSRPDAFDSLYAHGHLDVSTEGKFWLAANMVLGSRWAMTNPCTTKAHKGPRKVAFHYGDATVAANRSGIFLRKHDICSGNCQPPVDVTGKVTRLHHTYITIGLPRLPLDQTTQESYLQSVQVLLEIFRLLCAVDSAVVLYVFPTKARKILQQGLLDLAHGATIPQIALPSRPMPTKSGLGVAFAPFRAST